MLSLFFVTHHPESFTAKFDELFEFSEIIAIEFFYANGEKSEEDYWNAVSRGDADPPLRAEQFTKGLLERLSHTEMRVEFERSPVKKSETDQTDALRQEARKHWRQKQTEQAVGVLRRFEHEFASEIEKRDASYGQQLHDLSTKNPDKRILCVRGLLHQESLSRELQRRRVAFDPYRFKEPYVYSIAESVTVAFLHRDEVADDMLVRLHIEQDYSEKEIAADNFNYERRQAIREKVQSMSQAELAEYVASMKIE